MLARLARLLAARPRMVFPAREGFAASAVLVPIVVEDGAAPRLIFTQRRDDLRSHAGQVSFPGGQREPGDDGPRATALREAEEELGIPPARVEVLGLLDDLPTPTGFVITPVVGVIRAPIELRPQPSEVAEAFTVTLDELRAVHQDGPTLEFLGMRVRTHVYPWQGRYVWGATARMVEQLLGILGGGANSDGA